MPYLKNLYDDTMSRAYTYALSQVSGDKILDCGCYKGGLAAHFPDSEYHGVDWNAEIIEEGKSRGLRVKRADLNELLPYENDTFDCVIALSVLEHLLMPCRFMSEATRVLKPSGKLVLLTPNISTYFSIALLLLGRMPSTGPHPDSEALAQHSARSVNMKPDLNPDVSCAEAVHRHLIVFSYRALRTYLGMLGLSRIEGKGFGVYPFPRWSQPALERLDPYHAHQMVFSASKPEP
jgi:SAM-dependent methyltransferase